MIKLLIDVDGILVTILCQLEEETGAVFYDLFVDGSCINEGEPFWDLPGPDDIRLFLNQ